MGSGLYAPRTLTRRTDDGMTLDAPCGPHRMDAGGSMSDARAMVDNIPQPPAGSLPPPPPTSTQELAAPPDPEVALARWENEGGAVTEAPVSPRPIAC
jgi:hypothetical protein